MARAKNTPQTKLLDSTSELNESIESLQKNTLKIDDYEKIKKALSNFKLESACETRMVDGKPEKGVIRFDENPIFTKIIHLYEENGEFAKHITDIVNAPYKSSYYITEFLVDFIGKLINNSELIKEKKKYMDQLILSPFYTLSITSVCLTYMDLIKENLEYPSDALVMKRLGIEDISKLQKISDKLAFKHLLLESILYYLIYLSKAKNKIGEQEYKVLASGNKYNLKVYESVEKVIILHNYLIQNWGINDVDELDEVEKKEELGFI